MQLTLLNYLIDFILIINEYALEVNINVGLFNGIRLIVIIILYKPYLIDPLVILK
mgnify:CR=1 FL=1